MLALYVRCLREYPIAAVDWAFEDYMAQPVWPDGSQEFIEPGAIGRRCRQWMEREAEAVRGDSKEQAVREQQRYREWVAAGVIKPNSPKKPAERGKILRRQRPLVSPAPDGKFPALTEEQWEARRALLKKQAEEMIHGGSSNTAAGNTAAE